MKFITYFALLATILFAACGCGGLNYEVRHVDNSMLLWSAMGTASRNELVEAVRQAMADAPGATAVFESYPNFENEIIWRDGKGRGRKLSITFNFGNGNSEMRGVYFTAIYFARVDSDRASAIDSEARGRLQNLLDDLQTRLGRHRMTSVDGVVVR